jgi:large subunit ribosomal protein L18
MQKNKQQLRTRRHYRIRSKVKGTASQPRLSVFRSNSHIYAQIIDDNTGNTIVSANDQKIKAPKKSDLTTKCAIAFAVGQTIGQLALEKKVKQIVFDRGGYRYHGRVKSLAEGARAAGLKF